MRLLIWHVDTFAAEPTERGRSKIAEAEPRPVAIDQGLVIFAATEKADEADPDAVAERAVAAIEDIAGRLGERIVVLCTPSPTSSSSFPPPPSPAPSSTASSACSKTAATPSPRPPSAGSNSNIRVQCALRYVA